MRNYRWLRDFSGAWVFYSILPKIPWAQISFYRIARFAPLIGILIGSLQCILWIILNTIGWSYTANALCSIAFGAWITGGIHIDGLIDTADGLGAGKEKCLDAMRDSRIGASGVQCLMITLLLQIAALIELESFAPVAIIICNFWGRFSPLIAISNFNYLHKRRSGLSHQENWKGIQLEIIPSLIILTGIIITISVTTIEGYSKIKLLFCLLIGIFPAITIANILGKKLGGHSGDSYGASVVLTETCTLLLLRFILR